MVGCRRLAIDRFGVCATVVLGVRRVVGMGLVFARVLLMGTLVMGIFFAAFGNDRRRRRSRGVGQIGLGFRRRRLAGMSMLMQVPTSFMVTSFMVMSFMVMVVMVMRIMFVMAEIGGVRFVATMGVKLRLVARVIRRMLVISRLFGVGGIGAGCLDDAALHALAIAATARVAVARAAAVVGAVLALFLGLAMGALVGFDQRLTVGNRNLVIIGMDFAEGEETVTVAAIFDEGGLQRRLYARDLGEVDISTQLFALGGLEIKFFDAIAADHDNPGLFRVGGIDQHFVGHFGTLGGGGRVLR